jgi:hypothetical protein
VIVGLALTLAIGVVIIIGLQHSAAALTATMLGIYALFGAWSWIVTNECAACSEAASAISGLRVGRAGVAGTLVIVGAAVVAPSSPVLPIGAAAIAGAHTLLASVLVRRRIACLRCWCAYAVIVTAALVAPDAPGAWMIAAGALGAGAMKIALAFASLSQQALDPHGPLALLARQVAAETPSGKLRVVAYKAAGCPPCALYEADVEPKLLAEFGGDIEFEVRRSDRSSPRVPVPLTIVVGTVPIVVQGARYANVRGAILSARVLELCEMARLSPVVITFEEPVTSDGVTSRLAMRPTPK